MNDPRAAVGDDADPRPAHPVPERLGAAGRSFWTEVTEDFELRPDELRVLGMACAELDDIERLEVALVDAELIVNGSMGQPVANPLIAEARMHRGTLSSLLKHLKLPGAPDEETETTAHARKAAQARWDRSGARGSYGIAQGTR